MITKEQVVDTFREIVGEVGSEHVARTSVYIEDGPCCAVGHIFKRLDPERYAAIESDLLSLNLLGLDALMPASPGEEYDREALRLMRHAQEMSDNGHPWGDILGTLEDEL